MVGLSLFISGSHAGVKFRIIHFSAGLGTCYRDGRAKRQSVPKNNLAIKHIDSGGSRNPKAGENRLACSLTSGSTRAVTLELLIAIQRHHLSCRQYTTLYVGLQYNITSGTTAGIEFYAETV